MRRSGLSQQGLVVDPNSSSPLIRSYVAMLEQVSLAVRADRAPAVVVASPSRGDGRTTIACNLAICAAAVGGRRVLIVDGDLERKGMSRLFEANDRPGLAEALAGSAQWEEQLRTIGTAALSLLPAGKGINASLVAHADRVADLMTQWRTKFDWVVIDTAPVLLSAGASVVAARATGAVMVLRAGHTRPEVLAAALDRLREGGGKVLGSVLNRRRYMIPQGAYRRL